MPEKTDKPSSDGGYFWERFGKLVRDLAVDDTVVFVAGLTHAARGLGIISREVAEIATLEIAAASERSENDQRLALIRQIDRLLLYTRAFLAVSGECEAGP